MEHVDRETFLKLPPSEVAKHLHQRPGGSCVCVFPFNGTRRWFLLEHGRELKGDVFETYNDLSTKAYVSTYKLVFEHGLNTIVAPMFGGEILNRGDEYMEKIGANMSMLANHPTFTDFYKECDARVHFYGDYRKQLKDTKYSYLTDLFDEITQKTAKNKRNRLFFGVFGTDATETIAEITLQFHQTYNRIPTRRNLIEMYYGEYIEKADIFIGFEKFNVFDYPMLGWGEESLYFTVAPSLYLTGNQLRKILYDYIYLRPVQDPDYFNMPAEDLDAMRRFYEINREVTFGIGEMRGRIWYPKSGVKE